MNPWTANPEALYRHDDPTYWRNGAQLDRPHFYGPERVRSLGELLIAIALDPVHPTETDVVDR